MSSTPTPTTPETSLTLTTGRVTLHMDREAEDVYLEVLATATPAEVVRGLTAAYAWGYVPLLAEGEPAEETATGLRLHCRFGDEMLARA